MSRMLELHLTPESVARNKATFQRLIGSRKFSVRPYYGAVNLPGTHFWFASKGLSPGYCIYVEESADGGIFLDLGV